MIGCKNARFGDPPGLVRCLFNFSHDGNLRHNSLLGLLIMQFRPDAFVCSLVRVSGFGGKTPNAGSRSTTYSADIGEYKSLSDFKADMKVDALSFCKNYLDISIMSLVFMSCISTQTRTYSFLHELFADYETHIPRYLKYKHGIYYYSIPSADFCRILGLPEPKYSTYDNYTDPSLTENQQKGLD